jgi:hypothetical protein
MGVSSISSAHDPSATAALVYVEVAASLSGWRILWSPRKSPRPIFWGFCFLGAALYS